MNKEKLAKHKDLNGDHIQETEFSRVRILSRSILCSNFFHPHPTNHNHFPNIPFVRYCIVAPDIIFAFYHFAFIFIFLLILYLIMFGCRLTR